ncbi:MAG: hypothetical protein JWP91_1933 [Fibrobacteres bacterium]|nr:hypothetical protein [Fibrobacterota bacterium]
MANAAAAGFLAAALLAVSPLPVRAADAPPAWDRPATVAVETDFLRDRLEAPQNHFLLNGQEGFISGREFYQTFGDATPFLWPTHPFLRYGTDRSWQSDTLTLVARALGSNEIAEPSSPYAFSDIAWSPIEELRLHAGLDQNGLYSQRTFPNRKLISSRGNDAKLAWFGRDLPLKSQANVGAAFERRGGTMAAQYNQGWWWTTSPVSGQAYPWEGFNAELLYKAGEDFDLTLVEQQWDSPSPFQFDKSHWRRSEITMSFLGSSEGAWLWRLDLGFQRRTMSSKGAFESFEEKTYPFRFRYRQDWSAPDSLPFRMVSQGTMGIRERMIQIQHSSEFRETVGSHQPMQFLRGYYRHRMQGYVEPTEILTPDTTFLAVNQPGSQARGWVTGAEYREVRKHFLVGIGGDYAMEWELPIFHLGVLDTLGEALRRQGSYLGSDHLLQNASGKIFASGEAAKQVTWRLQAGMREFWSHDADEIEFRPSPWWAGGGAGWALPGKAGQTRLDAQATYLGPKEVRGWGPVFKVPTHWENHISLSQTLFSDRLKLSLSALHAFGEDFRDQPNGNPVRFRVMGGIEGLIY